MSISRRHRQVGRRRLRAAGKIPAICYGQAEAPLPLTVDPTALLKSLDPVKKTNTVLDADRRRRSQR